MKYYICSVCSTYRRLRDSATFKCRYCGSVEGRELSKREYEGHAK